MELTKLITCLKLVCLLFPHAWPISPSRSHQKRTKTSNLVLTLDLESPLASSTDAAGQILNSYTFPPNSAATKYPTISALMQACFSTVTPWNPGHAKVLLLLTDQVGLDAGDNAAFGFQNIPNNYDDVLNGTFFLLPHPSTNVSEHKYLLLGGRLACFLLDNPCPNGPLSDG